MHAHASPAAPDSLLTPGPSLLQMLPVPHTLPWHAPHAPWSRQSWAPQHVHTCERAHAAEGQGRHKPPSMGASHKNGCQLVSRRPETRRGQRHPAGSNPLTNARATHAWPSTDSLTTTCMVTCPAQPSPYSPPCTLTCVLRDHAPIHHHIHAYISCQIVPLLPTTHTYMCLAGPRPDSPPRCSKSSSQGCS